MSFLLDSSVVTAVNYVPSSGQNSVLMGDEIVTMTNTTMGEYFGQVASGVQYLAFGYLTSHNATLQTLGGIDVIGKRGNLIVVIECKEVKKPNAKMLRKVHFLEKCADELPFKTGWLMANRNSAQLVELRDKGLPKIDAGDWVLPLVVSTFVSGYERTDVAILTYLELERFCGLLDEIKIKEQGETHTMEMGEAIGRSGVRTRLIQVSA